ncbi:alpha-2-macroglobulin family protein [Ilumatobacter sp.]|uniref:alpha-2-macroglobulin family protein n=1 Tax=Ilumatobacter sp. TaxID=1967498 RepID=UPI003AF9C00B
MASATARRLTAAVVVMSTALSACWFGGDDESDPAPATTVPATGSTDEPVVNVEGAIDTNEAAQLGLRLSEGVPAQAAAVDIDVVEGAPIAPADVEAIFDRLPPWDVPDTDRSDFERPPQTLPPPLVVEPIEVTFPPAPTATEPESPATGPLEVVRFQPEGEVDVAPFLSVTFDQPMVPVTTLDQLDDADVPVEISPAIDGRWRWIGTRTLRFEVVPGEFDRLPAATDYRVTVPAGTTSAVGGRLSRDVGWTFSTPPPTVTQFVGDAESTSLTPVFVAVFDQRVDPEGVVATSSLEVEGETVSMRVATDDEVDADRNARTAVSSALAGRAVAFRPVGELPPDSTFRVTIGPDIPSAEGPRTSPRTESFDGRTFGSLELVRTNCESGNGCEPGTPFVFEFSNALDGAEFSADLVSVEPAIPNLSINVFGNVVELQGRTAGRTTYTVRFDGELSDVFGQKLGEPVSVDVEVGSARPALIGLPREWITTDPTAETPHVNVTTINHESIRARVWAVSPVDLDAFRAYQEAQWSDEDAPDPDWPLLFDEVIEIDAGEDEYVETAIDLSSAFAEVGSQVVVRVDPTRDFSPNDDDYWRNRPTISWVQSTTIGIDAFFDHQRLVIWTTDLRTGDPLGGVPVELIGDGRIATTDEEGLAELDLGEEGTLGLWANTGDGTSFLPAQWYEGWTASSRSDEGRWFVFDDRGIYRPGETVRITGWLRNFTSSAEARLELYDDGVSVRYTAWDAQGNEIASGTTDLNALGGFNLAVDIPEGANLGPAWVEFQAVGLGPDQFASTTHSFSIQEFRRPEFEVTADTETAGPFYVAEPATVRVDAEYFSGGPLPDADVEWLVSRRDTTYRPPNWDEYTFGLWTPWWGYGGDVAVERSADVAFEPCFDCGPGFATEFEQFTGRTDAAGSHYLQIDFDGREVDLPTAVTAEATVFDVDRQAWASRTDLLVHAAEYYVGLRSDRAFVREGTPIRIDAVVTDVDGGTVPGRDVTVTAGRVEWVLAGGEWVEQIADELTCSVTSTADASDGSMRCGFAADVGGTYRITATVTDDAGRTNRTEMTQWVSGGEGRPTRNVEQGSVTIVPDRDEYEVGDTAELLVQAPFSPAHGIVTVMHGGIVSTEAFEAEDGSAVVEIPIEAEWVPNVDVQVDMAGSDERTDDDGNPQPDLPPRPAYATGRIGLPIPPLDRALTVVATPADEAVEPGDDTSVTVAVADADGAPVSGADVAIVVIDEAVLSLTGYELADPLDVFYADIWSNLSSEYMRSSILLARSDQVTAEGDDLARATTAEAAPTDTSAGGDAEEMSADADGAVDEAGAGAAAEPIDLRRDFEALAVYAPSETTDAGGEVTVDVPLPDSLTRYRVLAVAVDGATRFGKGESTITARLPLQVRPSAPRFLNFGDEFELPVVLQNQTDEAIDVDVAVQTANLRLTGPVGRTVTVPPRDRVEVRFPTSADEAGIARIRIAAVNGSFADAAEIELPVYTPATAEAFATYGVIDEGAIAQPTAAPADVFPQFGGLEINTSSTALQALTDAVLYLTDYRYESADGLASRIMAIATLRDVLDAFDAAGLPDPTELEAAVARDLEALTALQNDDGGWPYWQRGRQSIPWVSIQATHAMVLAQQAGYEVPADTLDRALTNLAAIEESFPTDYGEEIRNALSSYALYVRGEAGQRDVAKATALYEFAVEDLEPDAMAWLWPSIDDPALRDDVERRLVNSAVETAGAATFATSYGEDAYVIAQSDHKTDGIVLDALITQTPDSDLVPKVVAGLLGGQTRGRWNNAHENAFVLVALDRYFDTFESVTPDFVARAWLGDLYAAEVPFAGRTTDQVSTLVPMAEVLSVGDGTITLQKDGEGRLYYRLGTRYAPTDLILDARDEGFVVDRVYEAVGDTTDVRREPDGTWVIAAGAEVRVRVTMVADARRTHVALIDPLPAGLEPLNPALAVSQTIPPPSTDEGGEGDIAAPFESSWWWGWNWFEHQNLRDDRAEAFSSLLPGGTYEYTYIARATTPGTFVVPPARAEEIYAPEVFGRSPSATVVIG